MVVAVARHLRPELTPERAVGELTRQPGCIEEVVEAIAARAPQDAVVGGRSALKEAVRQLLGGWERVVEALGPRASYQERRGLKPLLHLPLDPELINLDPPEHRRFVAARSMRDVEANVALRVRDPSGRPFRADDVA